MKTRLLWVVLPLVLVAAACGGGEGDTTPPAQTETETDAEAETETETEAQTEDPAETTMAPEEMSGVHVGDSEHGEILVGPEGLTLYIFTADTDGTSTCTDSCAELWPPVPADVAISADLDQSMFGTTTRGDGSEQLTVNGMPLYWYTPDTAPGDTNGQGFSDVWFVVDSGGEMIQAAAGDTEDDNPIIDYDY